VRGHVVEIADVPFGRCLAEQGIATAQSPEVDLMPAQPGAIVPDFEFAHRDRLDGSFPRDRHTGRDQIVEMRLRIGFRPEADLAGAAKRRVVGFEVQ
jgi:hypothetical protein